VTAYANRSLYQHVMWTCGILFGVGEVFLLRAQSAADFRIWAFTVLSLVLIWGLCHRRNDLIARGKPLFELSRSQRHILADYACSIGSVSLFTQLVYVVSSPSPLFQGTILSLDGYVLGFNIVVFSIGYAELTSIARAERERPPAPFQ
jgi:hypothetical protein